MDAFGSKTCCFQVRNVGTFIIYLEFKTKQNSTFPFLFSFLFPDYKLTKKVLDSGVGL